MNKKPLLKEIKTLTEARQDIVNLRKRLLQRELCDVLEPVSSQYFLLALTSLESAKGYLALAAMEQGKGKQ